MKLSIIIPYYNAKDTLDDILDALAPQMTKDVEVIIVDDGSYEKYKTPYKWAKVYRQRNSGTGIARNTGIEKSKGEYITFIDADDSIADNYISKILEKIKEGFDLCEMSWRSADHRGMWFDYKLNSPKDRLTNPAVWCRVFNRAFLGDIRFPAYKDSTEDEDFSRRVGYLDPDLKCKRVIIPEYMYFYRCSIEDSQSKLYKKGYYTTRRVVYYYDHVTADMTDLVEQIKADDVYNEVWLLTNKNEIPELKRWCQISKPIRIWTHYLKGEPYDNVEILPPMLKTQVVLFIHNTNVVGGIETFILTFARIFKEFYDITLMIDNVSPELRARYAKHIRVISTNTEIACDTLIVLRILDEVPKNVHYRKSIRMCHGCKTDDRLHIYNDTDLAVTVSEAARKTFGDEGERAITIHNPIIKVERKALLLMSATRIPAPDKGWHEKRMRKLAQMLNDADIPFLWLNFSDGVLNDPPKGFQNMGLFQGCQEYIARADYLVQLSDVEAYAYSILEALIHNVPVIVCPFESAAEQGVVDGENGYVVPFDMDFDVNKLLDIPRFEYTYDNKPIIAAWRELLGAKKPLHDYNPDALVEAEVRSQYFDMQLNKELIPGMIVKMPQDRAEYLQTRGFVRVLV